jgi:hypothetical protein
VPVLLDAWDRYAKVLDDQLQTLADTEPDMEHFGDLAQRREELAREIEEIGAPTEENTPRHEGALVRRAMEACAVRDRAVLDRLSRLRRATADAIRGQDDRKRGREGYLAGDHAAAADRPHRVNLRS